MKIFLLLQILLLSVIALPAQVFNMGDSPSTTSCLGTLYDSGGQNGDYSNFEDLTFTICPSNPFECLNLNIEEYEIEEDYDFLTIYLGPNTNGPQIAQLTGFGGNVNYQVTSSCVTVRFESDFITREAGFKMTWGCSADPCTAPPIISCLDPIEIPQLPYSNNNLSTCGAGNTVTSGPCDDDEHLQGEDYIFTYNSPGNECISISLSGTLNGTAVAVYDDCPNNANDCMAVAGGLAGQANPELNAISLSNPGTYYIVVANPSLCTPFNISVEQADCPIVFPSAAQCEDALSLNGCGDLPAIITVGPGQGDPACIQQSVNDGCWPFNLIIFPFPTWEPAFPFNYTWFYFEAQADGEFGFVMEAANPDEASDIDFQIWGPINDPANGCNFIKNNQPIRSSYADGADPTGLANTHPVTGWNVNDTCEDADGDDFLKTIQVQEGEVYFVLVNDWGEAITSGAVSIDFSNTTDGVLGGEDEVFSISPDQIVCPGEQVQLEASGGAIYQWLNPQGLSCDDCPDPVATVSQSTTYEVIIYGLCETDTLSVNIDLVDVDAGADLEVCLNGTVQLSVGSGFSATNYQWSGPAGTLSCDDCPNPVVTGLAAGSFDYSVTVSGPNCSATDDVQVTVLDAQAPEFEIIDDANICAGEIINIGGNANTGVSYSWTANNSNFNSDEANPGINPLETTTYYLEANNQGCPFPVIDSVLITVDQLPQNLEISPEDITICEGESTNLTSPSFDQSQFPNISFEWQPNQGLQDPAGDYNMTVQPSETTTYFRIVHNGACVDTSFATVNVVLPELTIIPENATICEGDTLELTAEANGDIILAWQPSEGLSCDDCPTPLAFPDISTIYFVSGTVSGCPVSGSTMIDVNTPDFILEEIFSVPDTNIVFEGTEVELMAQVDTQNPQNLLYEWSTGETTESIIVNPLDNPTYYLTITDANGCSQEAEISFETLESEPKIPNVFTPDGDGMNDIFEVVTFGAPVEVLNFQIFNRWGQLVHESSGENHGWNGQQDGKAAPSDVYVYRAIILLTNGKEQVQQGDVMLLR